MFKIYRQSKIADRLERDVVYTSAGCKASLRGGLLKTGTAADRPEERDIFDTSAGCKAALRGGLLKTITAADRPEERDVVDTSVGCKAALKSDDRNCC